MFLECKFFWSKQKRCLNILLKIQNESDKEDFDKDIFDKEDSDEEN